MAIKSDRWIRRMVREMGMIDPFEPAQVREGEHGRVISYGTSSYGYDVRCADEFKIFTNINSAIVDPKSFDSNSFVDLQSDVCIIPPNSFALARTVEHFRIPRNVLTICLGKSTYARCFRGDTRVALRDGSTPTLEEMAVRADAGERFEGYSLDAQGHVVASRLEAPRFIGRDALMGLRLTNGALIHCTGDHEFLMSDGRRAPAHRLRVHDVFSCGVVEPQNAPASHSGIAAPPFGNAAHPPRLSGLSELPGDHDVYCLTVPEFGNFALAAGVFTSNCGIIVNVTPLEPEWEGHVTLEFSNTTPLPAKIYANEGVAQILFFESDEMCETSYKDRGGKYQGQRGVTLPKS